ncbi:DUF4241 domain-containing protein [Kaistella antarctica]|uniref:DUF4241 domain-containing protein n=1 Tax=Kaistella antarctica TaxID=266748 RepID=A0A448NS06_9FLAO|nr:DUF4241 domain-containing protein [Kaistella antarctica]KEY18637.1 hypothetical protein HY04_09085 [Kaistella antarctica]SEW17195.1 Protein of unknown function [Kaistella antarctica]VEH99777.1 Uncharacterised protein [Kaistella antarctica]
MNHIEDIKKLFDKDFVESPLIETFEAGNIVLTSGKLVASDPLITSEMPPFMTDFPIGEFPVLVHKEIESNCIAYVEMVFKNAEIATWKLATSDGQNMTELEEGEIYGFPVESGMGCLMDFETQENLILLEQHLFKRKGEEFMGIYEEFFHEHFFQEEGAVNQYAFLKPHEEKPGNLFAFETGYGEGFYASYIGFDKNEIPVKVVCEFIEIN